MLAVRNIGGLLSPRYRGAGGARSSGLLRRGIRGGRNGGFPALSCISSR